MERGCLAMLVMIGNHFDLEVRLGIARRQMATGSYGLMEHYVMKCVMGRCVVGHRLMVSVIDRNLRNEIKRFLFDTSFLYSERFE